MRIAPLLLLLACACIARASDQPQWGQRHTRNMVSDERNLPDDFDPATGRNIKWRISLGSQSYPTPVVAGGRVYIGTNNDNTRDPRHKGDRGVLLCLNEADGKLLWQLVIPKRIPDPYYDWPRGGITSPVTVVGDRVYVVTNRGQVMCLDAKGLADGNDGAQDEGSLMAQPGEPPMQPGPLDADVIWSFDPVAEAGTYPHDAGFASILIGGDLLYVNTSNGVDNTHRKIRAPEGPCLIVLDKNTGRYVARDNEGIGPRIFHCTWSSPGLGMVNGRPRIFFAGPDGVCYGFEPPALPAPGAPPASLARAWRFDTDPSGPKENVHRWTGNRREGPSSILGMPVFQDGRLYVTCGGDIWWGKNQGWIKCLDATGNGESTDSAQIWSYAANARICSTPSVHDGLVYAGDTGRKLHCVDAKTGQAVWTHDTEGEIWASTLVADGKVYLGTRKGDLWILAAGREKRVIRRVDLGSGIAGGVVAANGALYIATMRDLFAIR